MGMELILTGIDIEEKAKSFVDTLFNSLGGKDQFDEVVIDLHQTQKNNPNSNEEAMASLNISVKSMDPNLVGRLFTAKIVELSLSNYPGFFARSSVKPNGPVIVYWPTLIDSKYVKEKVYIDGKVIDITPTNQLNLEEMFYQRQPVKISKAPKADLTERLFGEIFGTRSGDKGGCANLGVWAKNNESFAFLHDFLTIEKLKELMPDLAQFDIDRYELPNIKSLNFYIHDILEDGVSSNNRIDSQAKSLGEYLRAKLIKIPSSLIQEKNNGQ